MPLAMPVGEARTAKQPAPPRAAERCAPVTRFGAFCGASAAMRALIARLPPIAALELPVLLRGETGTGKDLLANELHAHSARRAGPFVVVDCAAISPALIESELFGHRAGAFTGATEARLGAFQAARGGTLLLDELGDLPLALQSRLLRAVEQKEIKPVGADDYERVDVRLIAATHRDLRAGIAEGWFRTDLYFRIAAIELEIPPLRERPEDVELLARELLQHEARQQEHAKANALPDGALELLRAHRWPGNVRELRNVLERLAVLDDEPQPDELQSLLLAAAPGAAAAADDAGELLAAAQLERLSRLPFHAAKEELMSFFDAAYVKRLLDQSGHNLAEAARRAEIHRSHLFRLVKKYGLQRR